MSEVVGELARARDALARPTLQLLDGKWAAFRVVALRCSFSRDRRSVQADRLHVQVDIFLSELQREGIEVPPNTTPVARVQRFNRVGRTDHRPDLNVIIEKWNLSAVASSAS